MLVLILVLVRILIRILMLVLIHLLILVLALIFVLVLLLLPLPLRLPPLILLLLLQLRLLRFQRLVQGTDAAALSVVAVDDDAIAAVTPAIVDFKANTCYPQTQSPLNDYATRVSHPPHNAWHDLQMAAGTLRVLTTHLVQPLATNALAGTGPPRWIDIP